MEYSWNTAMPGPRYAAAMQTYSDLADYAQFLLCHIIGLDSTGQNICCCKLYLRHLLTKCSIYRTVVFV